ncbi:MAG: hypothetical protein U0P46_11460 [Holophagaceae bacterium]
MAAPESTDVQVLSDQSIEPQAIEPQPWLRLALVMAVPVLLLLAGISLTR